MSFLVKNLDFILFFPQEKMILAASNDNACRIWGLHDQRLKVQISITQKVHMYLIV